MSQQWIGGSGSEPVKLNQRGDGSQERMDHYQVTIGFLQPCYVMVKRSVRPFFKENRKKYIRAFRVFSTLLYLAH